MNCVANSNPKISWSLLCFFLFLFFTSCQTSRRLHESISMPVILQPMFGACVPSEDEASIDIHKGDSRIFSATMVWSFLGDRGSSAQINSPFGDTVLEVQSNDGRWSTSGRVELKISENPNGFLRVESYDLPLKTAELGCILAGLWPAQWLRWLTVTKDERKVFRIEGSDGQRTVKIEMNNYGSMTSAGNDDGIGCATLTWGGFLGFFQRQAEVCRARVANGVKLRLSGINNYLIEWTIGNGS